jgi:UDP-glucose 4-epimerase
VRVPRAYNQVFNIGADVPHSVNSLAQCVSDAMGVKPNVAHLPVRNEVMHAYSSHAKVAEFFEAPPAYSLPEGLARMAAWVREVGARATPFFQDIEVPNHMPPSWLSR